MTYRGAIILVSLLQLIPPSVFIAIFRDPTKSRSGPRWWVATWLRMNSLSFFVAFARTAEASIVSSHRGIPSPHWDYTSFSMLVFTLVTSYYGLYVFLRNRYWGHK
jgi:hypothetical protein